MDTGELGWICLGGVGCGIDGHARREGGDGDVRVKPMSVQRGVSGGSGGVYVTAADRPQQTCRRTDDRATYPHFSLPKPCALEQTHGLNTIRPENACAGPQC